MVAGGGGPCAPPSTGRARAGASCWTWARARAIWPATCAAPASPGWSRATSPGRCWWPGVARRAVDDDGALRWLLSDALHLPFADDCFDAVTSGFLLRNLTSLPAAFAEMLRVLRPGGRLVALDMTHAPPGPLGTLTRFGVERVVTPTAGWASGRRSAYHYLRRSLEGHPDAEAMVALLRAAGAEEAGYERMGLGAVALHTGRKPGAGEGRSR